MLNSNLSNIVQAILLVITNLKLKVHLLNRKLYVTDMNTTVVKGQQTIMNNWKVKHQMITANQTETLTVVISQTEILTIGAEEIIEAKMKVLYRIVAMDGDR